MEQNKNKKILLARGLATGLVIGFVVANFFVTAIYAQEDQSTPDDENLSRLNEEISDKRGEISTLQKEIDAYQEQIAAKQKEAKSLNNQIAILGNQLAKINLDIESTELKIEKTKLEIQSLNLQIKELEDKIAEKKEKISQYLRLIYKNDQISYLEILLKNTAFSDFYDQIKYTEQINNDLKTALEKFKSDKLGLEGDKINLEEKVEEENKLKDELQAEKDELSEKTSAQEILLVQARLTERQYKNFQYQLQLEQQQINSDIVTLEQQLRKQLEDREVKERFRGFGPARLAWPVSTARGISAYFHDPDYPFRHIFEHPAIDIRAYQGTAVTAAESGYVGRVKFSGNSSYAYVMIIHNDGLSTVYGHVSAVYVAENEFVTQGQTIALSGGAPGTTGAGNLSTGAHLHFETRLNGIPVNPLEYLP